MYAILGVTGNTGRAAAETLLQGGQPVRVVVRAADKGAPWAARGAEVALADLTDAEALARALDGTTGSYLLNPPRHDDTDPLGTAARVGEAFRQVLDRGVTGRAVVLSSVGAQHPGGTGMVGSVHRVEQAVRGATVPVTFLRPAFFAENWLPLIAYGRGEGRLPSFQTPLDRPVPTVATADIGRVAAELLLAAGSAEMVELAGPEDVTPYQVAAAAGLAEVFALPREHWSATIGSWGVSPAVRDLLAELYDAMNAGHVDFAGSSVLRGRVGLAEALGRSSS